MLLTGTFHRSLDDKHRVAIPKRLRETLQIEGVEQPALFLAPGTDGSLALYTERTFAQLAEQLGSTSPTGHDVRAFSRLFYAQAQRIELDRQGRVRLPIELARLAGLSREIVLLGVRDHLEVWDRSRWQAYLEQKLPQYDEIAENAFRDESSGGKRRPEASGGQATSGAGSTEESGRPGQPR